MKYWYEIHIEGRVTKYDVIKDIRVAVSTNCDWSDDKLAAAIGDVAAKEDGMTDVRVVHSHRLTTAPNKNDSYYAKVFDLDRALGI